MIEPGAELSRILSFPVDTGKIYRPASAAGVVLYGAGKMGVMALELMRVAGVRPLYIVDKTAKGEIDGVPVIAPDKIPEQDKHSLTFVVCIVTLPVRPLVEYLRGLGCADVRPFYDYSQATFPRLMPNGWEQISVSGDDRAQIAGVLRSLAHDDRSVADYLRLLWWRLRRVDLAYTEYPVLSAKKYFRAPGFPALGEKEVYVDGGAHFGAVIEEFITAASGKYERIRAFEPDPVNLEVLRKNLPPGDARISISAEALYDSNGSVKFRPGLGYASATSGDGPAEVKTVTLDSLAGIAPTIIKLHIEGDELKALRGAREKIKEYRPILMVLADHGPDGLLRIPMLLAGLPDYKLYFNLHDYCGNTSIFYSYPVERLEHNGN